MLRSHSPRTQALRLDGGTQMRHNSQLMAAPLRGPTRTIITIDGRTTDGQITRSVLAVQGSTARGLAYSSLSTSSQESAFSPSTSKRLFVIR